MNTTLKEEHVADVDAAARHTAAARLCGEHLHLGLELLVEEDDHQRPRDDGDGHDGGDGDEILLGDLAVDEIAQRSVDDRACGTVRHHALILQRAYDGKSYGGQCDADRPYEGDHSYAYADGGQYGESGRRADDFLDLAHVHLQRFGAAKGVDYVIERHSHDKDHHRAVQPVDERAVRTECERRKCRDHFFSPKMRKRAVSRPEGLLFPPVRAGT